MVGGSQPLQAQDHQVALRALVAGGLLVRAAEAQGDQDTDAAFGHLGLRGLALAVIGANWVAKSACASVHCCLRRLRVLPSELHSFEDELEAEDRDLTTPLRLRRPRSRSSTTRVKAADESGSATEEEAGHHLTSENEATSAGDQVCETSRGKIDGKEGEPRGSSSLSASSERAIQAACAAADGAEKAAENAELAAQAAEQAAEQAMVAGQVAGQAVAASARLHRVVAQSSRRNLLRVTKEVRKLSQSPRTCGTGSSTSMLEEDGRPKRCGPNTIGPKA